MINAAAQLNPFTSKQYFSNQPLETEIEFISDEKNITAELALLELLKPKILLVEDNACIQKINRLFLTKMGCQTDLAEDGPDAITMATRTEYDLILMDIGLPTLSGIDATKAIRELNKKIPIIALTAYGSSVEEECRLAGTNGFLVKPISYEKLTKTIIEQLLLSKKEANQSSAPSTILNK